MEQQIIHIKNFLNQEEFSTLTNWVNNFTFNSNYVGWKLTGYSKEGDARFWHVDVSNIDFFTISIFSKIKTCVKKLTNKDVILHRVYLNGQTFGQQGFSHIDDPLPPQEGKTFLIYCNDEWNIEHGGATVFQMKDEIRTVYPEPFSAVCFDGNIPHFAQGTSKYFSKLRVTLAYKLEVIN